MVLAPVLSLSFLPGWSNDPHVLLLLLPFLDLVHFKLQPNFILKIKPDSAYHFIKLQENYWISQPAPGPGVVYNSP